MKKSANKFWKLVNSVDRSGSTLYLEGPISSDSWWGDEVTPQAFRDELKQITSNKLLVVINSTGGDVWAGVSIHDALKEFDGEVTIKVSGLAASIASVIAMAGDKIQMTPGSTMMVHRASTFAWGNAEELEKYIEMLETVEEGIVSIYADRTGLSKDEINDLLAAETWMSAEKAVELGFADEIVKPESSTEESQTLENAFNGNFAFSMSATKDAMDSFLAKAKVQNEVPSEEPDKPETDKPEEPETPPATPAPAADPSEEDEPNGDPNPETPAPSDDDDPENTDDEEESADTSTPANKSAKNKSKETPSMKTQDEIAAENIEKKKPEQAATPAQAAYLSTKQSVEDFAKVLVENAGKTPAEVKDAWGAKLAEMGVTNPEILLPDALITEIEDAFSKGGEIWNLLNKTGLTVFRAAWDTVTGEDSRAKGYNRAEAADKAEEVITIADRVLRPQFIYKYITLNKEDIKENRDTGALVRYVLSELPKRILREVERAVVIGDGRANDDDYKIDSFVAVKADAAANNVFAKRYVPEAGDARYKSLLKARDLVKADGSKYLVAKTGYLTDLLLEQGVNGGYIFAPGTDVARALGFAGSFEPDWLDDTNDADNDAYIVVFDAYKTVGDNTIEAFTNFVLKTNKQEYLQEIYAGGGLTKRDSAAAVATTPEAS